MILNWIRGLNSKMLEFMVSIEVISMTENTCWKLLACGPHKPSMVKFMTICKC
jgi:hypothetical protein